MALKDASLDIPGLAEQFKKKEEVAAAAEAAAAAKSVPEGEKIVIRRSLSSLSSIIVQSLNTPPSRLCSTSSKSLHQPFLLSHHRW